MNKMMKPTDLAIASMLIGELPLKTTLDCNLKISLKEIHKKKGYIVVDISMVGVDSGEEMITVIENLSVMLDGSVTVDFRDMLDDSIGIPINIEIL